MSIPTHDRIEPLPETIKYEKHPSYPGHGYLVPLWDSSCSLYPERELKRIADCWNACAGIDDPAAAIQAAKNALELAASLNASQSSYAENLSVVLAAMDALNLITPKP